MKRLCAALLLATSLFTTQAKAAQATIQFAPGPMDGVKIITPWGDYVAVSQGSSVWVGTEREYQDALVRAISRDDGFREICQTRETHCNSFVAADLPRSFVGRTEVAGITVAALYEVDPSVEKSRPKAAKGSEYVEVMWVQGGPGRVQAIVYDLTSKKSYRPNDCGLQSHQGYCDIIVPRAAMTNPVNIVFTAPHMQPGVLAAPSIVQVAAASIHHHLADMAKINLTISPTDPDDDAIRNLVKLHALDPSVELASVAVGK